MLTLVASPKSKMINVRLTPEMHDDFKIACNLRGVSMSSFLHQTIRATIREEKALEPRSFKKYESQQNKGESMHTSQGLPMVSLDKPSITRKRKTG